MIAKLKAVPAVSGELAARAKRDAAAGLTLIAFDVPVIEDASVSLIDLPEGEEGEVAVLVARPEGTEP